MDIETSSNIHGPNVFFCRFERTDIIQISNTTFSYNTFSILTDDSLKSKARFRIQLLLEKLHGILLILHLKKFNIVIVQLIGHWLI